jgi:hypothetical protein
MFITATWLLIKLTAELVHARRDYHLYRAEYAAAGAPQLLQSWPGPPAPLALHPCQTCAPLLRWDTLHLVHDRAGRHQRTSKRMARPAALLVVRRQ